jgi:hypothetical protein
MPWDDGSLKLALASAFDEDPERWAVSNAVLWSRRDKKGRNASPSDEAKSRSAEVWYEFLQALQPEIVATAGKVAEKLIDAVQKLGGRHAAGYHFSTRPQPIWQERRVPSMRMIFWQ